MELSIDFPAKKGKSPSHVSMRGGVHFVPPDREDEFFRTYERLVKENVKLYLVEQCNTQEFKFFLDIDLKAPEALDIPQITDICKRISKIVDGGKCVVLVAKPKQVGDQVKSGIHMVWFNYVVELEEAMNVRNQLVAELGTDYNWEDILDTSVYRAGIRLPWSWKYNKKTQQDESCYLPLCFLTEKQVVREVSQQPDAQVLKLCSVRMSKSGKREGQFSKAQMAKSIPDDGRFGELEIFIRKFAEGQKKTRVKSIMKKEANFLVVDTNSRYCENKGGIHAGNRIYFVINKEGIMYQKCFCKCDINRRLGFCKDFRGQRYRLPGSLVKKLFE